ncbi:aldehyde ferredoxin oxidoreductase N-terminal domain-containing protein [Chloroflexota bacterium]
MSYQGLILRVDLGTGDVSREAVPVELRRKYLGGEGINSRLLWEHFLEVARMLTL